MSLSLSERELSRVIELREKRKDIDNEIGRILTAGMVGTKSPPIATEAPDMSNAGDNGAISLNIDVSGIVFKQKDGAIAGPYAKWGWAFAYRQEGGYHEESQKIVQALEQYGKVQVGTRIYTLRGKNGNLLNFKEVGNQ